MPELHDLTAEQIEALFTAANSEAEAHAWVELCATQGQKALRHQDEMAEHAARWGLTPVPTEERLDAGEA